MLVPGPGDLGPGCSLPRPGLPKAVAAPLLEAVPNAVLASNPCRCAGPGGLAGLGLVWRYVGTPTSHFNPPGWCYCNPCRPAALALRCRIRHGGSELVLFRDNLQVGLRWSLAEGRAAQLHTGITASSCWQCWRTARW